MNFEWYVRHLSHLFLGSMMDDWISRAPRDPTAITFIFRYFMLIDEVISKIVSSNADEIKFILPPKSIPEMINTKSSLTPELQRIIRIIRYSNSWDRIVLFVFGIRSICNFRIVFEYPNSCYRIPNSYRLFIKQNVYQKYRKKASYSCKKKD